VERFEFDELVGGRVSAGAEVREGLESGRDVRTREGLIVKLVKIDSDENVGPSCNFSGVNGCNLKGVIAMWSSYLRVSNTVTYTIVSMQCSMFCQPNSRC
jgi:hypothetical protein